MTRQDEKLLCLICSRVAKTLAPKSPWVSYDDIYQTMALNLLELADTTPPGTRIVAAYRDTLDFVRYEKRRRTTSTESTQEESTDSTPESIAMAREALSMFTDDQLACLAKLDKPSNANNQRRWRLRGKLP